MSVCRVEPMAQEQPQESTKAGVTTESSPVPTWFKQDAGALKWICLALVAARCSTSMQLPELERVPSEPMTLVLYGVVATTCAVLALACWEALRYPRPPEHATWAQVFRTILQIIGDIMLIPLYGVLPAEAPILGYQPTPQNDKILARCPSLKSFKQTPWLRNPYLSFGALMAGDLGDAVLFKKFIRREVLEAPDGGIVAMDWWEEDGLGAGIESKGVLLVGSTFVGDALGVVTRGICRHFAARGWRCVVMVRRGCGLIMPNLQKASQNPNHPPTAPWCFTGLADLKLAIDHVERCCPGLPICGIGLSTGAWQFRQYIVHSGESSKLAGAVLLDSGSDWADCIFSLDRRCPLLSKALAGGAKRTFKQCGIPLFKADDTQEAEPSGEDYRPVPGGLVAFCMENLAPAHGWPRSVQAFLEYTRSCKFADDLSACAVPVMEMVSAKDTLMTAEAARLVADGYKASPHVITVEVREGTHMMRWQGWRPRCWVCPVAFEFLEAVLEQQRQKH